MDDIARQSAHDEMENCLSIRAHRDIWYWNELELVYAIVCRIRAQTLVNWPEAKFSRSLYYYFILSLFIFLSILFAQDNGIRVYDFIHRVNFIYLLRAFKMSDYALSVCAFSAHMHLFASIMTIFSFFFYLNYTRNLSPFLFLSTAVHMHDSNENFFVVAVSRDWT